MIGICALVALLEGFDLVSISIAAPVMMPGLGLDKGQTGEVFASGQFGLVIGGLLGGFAGDKFGRRNTLLFGAICFGLFCTLTVLADSFTTLLAVRTFTGFGIGLAIPNLISMAAECAPEKHRAKTISIILAGLPAGGMLVALVGSAYIETWGWHSLFYIGGLLPLGIAPLILLLPSYAAPRGSSTQGQPVRWTYALFGKHRAITTVLLWISLLLTAAILYMMVNWLPSLLTQRGYALRISHLASAMFSFGGSAGSFAIGFLVDRLGYRWVLPLLYVGVLVGIGGIALSHTAGPILLSSGILGVFIVSSFYSLNGASPLYYPAEVRGFCTGASVGMGRIGSVLGPLLGGFLLKEGLGSVAVGPPAVTMVTIPLILLASVAVYVLTRRSFDAQDLPEAVL